MDVPYEKNKYIFKNLKYLSQYLSQRTIKLK